MLLVFLSSIRVGYFYLLRELISDYFISKPCFRMFFSIFMKHFKLNLSISSINSYPIKLIFIIKFYDFIHSINISKLWTSYFYTEQHLEYRYYTTFCILMKSIKFHTYHIGSSSIFIPVNTKNSDTLSLCTFKISLSFFFWPFSNISEFKSFSFKNCLLYIFLLIYT